jgi:hypothetical protein
VFVDPTNFAELAFPVMDFVEGGTASLIKMDEERARQLFRDLVCGLFYSAWLTGMLFVR